MAHLRIRLGALRLANAGTLLTFTAETNAPRFRSRAWYGQHLNNSNSVVDFGDARTDGSVWLRREGNVWFLKTWPRERNFTLEFSRTRFDQPAKVQCTGGAAAAVTPVQTGLALAFAAQRRHRIPLDQPSAPPLHFPHQRGGRGFLAGLRERIHPGDRNGRGIRGRLDERQCPGSHHQWFN